MGILMMLVVKFLQGCLIGLLILVIVTLSIKSVSAQEFALSNMPSIIPQTGTLEEYNSPYSPIPELKKLADEKGVPFKTLQLRYQTEVETCIKNLSEYQENLQGQRLARIREAILARQFGPRKHKERELTHLSRLELETFLTLQWVEYHIPITCDANWFLNIRQELSRG